MSLKVLKKIESGVTGPLESHTPEQHGAWLTARLNSNSVMFLNSMREY